MKKKYTTLALAFAGIIGAGQLGAQTPGQPATPAPPAPPAPPEAPKLTDKEAFAIGSYALGFQQGQGMYGAGFSEGEFSAEELTKGLAAGLKGEDAAIPEAKIRAAMQILQGLAQKRTAVAKERAELLQKRAEEKQKIPFAGKIAENKKFLEKNAKREGVKTTSSGLQYEVLKKGGERKYVAPAGGAPDRGTKFVLHYKGTLINGEEFDSSIKHNPDGKPAEFTLEVVPGFSEALKTMPVGAKWKIFLPSELGYRGSPRGPGGPYSVIIFELELVDIKSAPPVTQIPPGFRPQQPGRPGARATTPPVQVPAQPKQPAKKEKAE